MRSSREKMISRTTSYLRGLAHRRPNNIVTADDIQNYLSRQGFSNNVNERLSVVRSVLNPNTGFHRIGTTQSTREAARGRTISTWTV